MFDYLRSEELPWIPWHCTSVMRPSRDVCVTHATTLQCISIASPFSDISVYHTGNNIKILRYPKFTDRPPSENKSERSRHTHEYCRLCIRKDLSKTQLSSLSCTVPSLENSYANFHNSSDQVEVYQMSFICTAETYSRKRKGLPLSLTLKLDADGDMVKDGVSVLALDSLHLNHRKSNT